jgi:hypothetical protein
MGRSLDTIRNEVKDLPSEEVALLLLLLDDTSTDPEHILVRVALADVLTTRHPEIEEALDRWSESLTDPRTMTEVIIEGLPRQVVDAMPKVISD